MIDPYSSAIPWTSNPNTRNHTVQITNKKMTKYGLPLASVTKVYKVFSLKQPLVRKTLGQLRQDVFDSIRTELIKLII